MAILRNYAYVYIGDFLELEVMMKDGQAVTEGEAIANELMGKLGIDPRNLITGAYMDMILSES